MTELPTTPVALQAERQRTIDVLCRQFAEDNLEVGEFERRLDQAHRALTIPDLQRLTADLPAPGAATQPVPASSGRSVPAAAPAQRPSPPASVARRGSQVIAGILGGATRRGRWTPATESVAIGIMGGVDLDFRDALLPAGETVVHAFALMGGISIIVPPELDVTVDGLGILGGFEHIAQGAAVPTEDAPRLRIDGVAIMGGVEVKVRAPGQPASDAGARAAARHALRARRQELREEARRLRDEWRGSR